MSVKFVIPETTMSVDFDKIAAFDLDWTIIKPKSGNKFPKNIDDWCFLNDKVVPTIQKLSADGYLIVIFTNQGSKDFTEAEFTVKLTNIQKFLKVPFIAYACVEKGWYRKPCIGMWEQMMPDITKDLGKVVDINSSFYVGDAAGREKDFSDSDYKFALNIGLKFMIPEEIFENKKVDYKVPVPVHPLRLALEKSVESTESNASDKQEMIILVGAPASGKSSYTKQKCFESYIVVNQDILGTKAKVMKLAEQSLKSGKSVIIDRKNEYVKDRKEFVDMTNRYKVNVRVVYFDVPRELCEHLNTYRGIKGGSVVPAIVYNKYYSTKCGLEKPELSEGFVSIEVMKGLIKVDKEDKILNMFLC